MKQQEGNGMRTFRAAAIAWKNEHKNGNKLQMTRKNNPKAFGINIQSSNMKVNT